MAPSGPFLGDSATARQQVDNERALLFVPERQDKSFH